MPQRVFNATCLIGASSPDCCWHIGCPLIKDHFGAYQDSGLIPLINSSKKLARPGQQQEKRRRIIIQK